MRARTCALPVMRTTPTRRGLLTYKFTNLGGNRWTRFPYCGYPQYLYFLDNPDIKAKIAYIK